MHRRTSCYSHPRKLSRINVLAASLRGAGATQFAGSFSYCCSRAFDCLHPLYSFPYLMYPRTRLHCTPSLSCGSSLKSLQRAFACTRLQVVSRGLTSDGVRTRVGLTPSPPPRGLLPLPPVAQQQHQRRPPRSLDSLRIVPHPTAPLHPLGRR